MVGEHAVSTADVTIVELPTGARMLDLGNGQAAVVGTEADMRAAADWLAEHYPDGPVGEQLPAVHGPIVAMGAHNVLAAYRLYADQVPPTSLLALVYMATVALDADAVPMWWEGHEILAIRVLGASEPVTEAALRAVRRAVTPLHRAGAITVDRHSSARGGTLITVRYRLWLTSPAPDDIRPVHNGVEPADIPPAPDGIRPVDDASTGRYLVEHRTVSVRLRRTRRMRSETTHIQVVTYGTWKVASQAA